MEAIGRFVQERLPRTAGVVDKDGEALRAWRLVCLVGAERVSFVVVSSCEQHAEDVLLARTSQAHVKNVTVESVEPVLTSDEVLIVDDRIHGDCV